MELSAHGSPVVLRAIVSAAIDRGARLAEPGEFTLRAFLNGRIDLMQAEAVADLIDAVTPLQARAAFDQLQGTLTRAIGEIDAALFDLIARLEASVDFPEEGYHFADPRALVGSIDVLIARTASLLSHARRGRLIREGLQIAIVGKPNVGKSSLFNALVGASRAIVTDVPGTTRDLLTEVVDFDGLRVTLVDTAGLRATRDIVEVEGVERARRAQDVSDLILLVLDRSQPLDDADREVVLQTRASQRLILANKADRPPAWESAWDESTHAVSATTGAGLEALRRCIAAALDIDPLTDRPEMTNVRHVAIVERAHEALVRARTAASPDAGRLSEEFVLADLQQARAVLGKFPPPHPDDPSGTSSRVFASENRIGRGVPRPACAVVSVQRTQELRDTETVLRHGRLQIGRGAVVEGTTDALEQQRTSDRGHHGFQEREQGKGSFGAVAGRRRSHEAHARRVAEDHDAGHVVAERRDCNGDPELVEGDEKRRPDGGEHTQIQRGRRPPPQHGLEDAPRQRRTRVGERQSKHGVTGRLPNRCRRGVRRNDFWRFSGVREVFEKLARDRVRVEADGLGIRANERAPENPGRPARNVVPFEPLKQGEADLGVRGDRRQ